MAYSSNPLWPPTQPTGLDSQVGGLFHNLETQDDLLDFHEPAKDLWESQTQGWDDLPNQVAEVALQDSPFPDPVNDGLSAVPFQDVPGEQPPMEPAFQDTGAAGSSEDEAEPETLPPWTCSYCGQHNPKVVAQCEVTGKWFCNGHVAPGGSCVIQHLVRGRYKEVRLHPQSPLGNTVLECYHSGSRNIFSLGFVPVKGDDTIVLLARDTPATAACVKELDLDMSLWESIIQDRGIVPWLVQSPSKQECGRARRLTAGQMNKLEAAWKADPDASLETVQEEASSQKDLLRGALRYENAFEYQNVLAPLVQIEADYDKACREALRKENLQVNWQQSNKRWVATFYFPRDDEAVHVVPGDELVLQHETAGPNNTPWEASGVVVRITSSEEIALELHTGKNDVVPSTETLGFAAELTWNSTAYDRMQQGLKTFAENSECMSDLLYHQILGHAPEMPRLQHRRPAAFQAPNMPVPNHSQVAALEAALAQPFTLIQGPPGTGKTITSTTLVWLLHQVAGGKVLMAAPSNVAVDHLAEKISSTGLKVVRLCSQRAQVNISPTVEHLTLHYQVANIRVPGHEQLQKLFDLKKDKGELSLDNERRLHALMRKFEAEIIQAADVVCVTCIGAGDKRLKRFKFPIVLIDESTQATEPECLLPITLGARQAVLVGDHCQLGPVVMNKLAERNGLSQSLVERMILCGVRPVRLQVQYRMHPCLSEFPSNVFYEGALQNGVTEAERTNPLVAFPWPDPTKCMMFYQQRGVEEISSSGTSYVNRQEAAAVEKVVSMFLSYDVKPQQIGVVTPYEGQRAQIVRTMEQMGPLNKVLYQGIEVASVDAFQGREKDYIIFSCVRASTMQGIGFLADPRRLNVALTRAKYGCVIIGNASVLCKQALWHSLLTYLRARSLLVEGPLSKLQTSHVPLPNPDYKFDRRSFLIGTTLSTRYRPTETVVYPDSSEIGNTLASHVPAVPPVAPGVPGFPGQPVAPQRPRPFMSGLPENPYAIGPLVMPQAVLTQEALSLDQLSQRGLSLAALGHQMSYGIGGGLDASQRGLEGGLPEYRGFFNPPQHPLGRG